MVVTYTQSADVVVDGPSQPSAETEPAPKVRKQLPQSSVDTFWGKFKTKNPGKVLSILPSDIYAKTKASKTTKGVVEGQFTAKSYDQAASECKNAVKKISQECRRVNHKYRDLHFDVEWDLKSGPSDCLRSLNDIEGNHLDPGSVKRVTDIFEKPQFFEDGPTASDVRQGCNGDCWFISALAALCNKPGLVEKVCVEKDEAVGVYGFVFHRDGEWIQTIVDDKLYLLASDWWESADWEKWILKAVNKHEAEERFRKANQTGSRALYFAQCSTENETWLPLLEKAYAKAHGDFSSIEGGFTGEAIEDLTGGVVTELFTTDILDKNDFWSNEIMKVNEEFLFGCSTGSFDGWRNPDVEESDGARSNIHSRHAYSIMEAKEIKGLRLLRVRNPWGHNEWKGPWSDGSEQWTPEWMELLNHKFGDDGMFWISYDDMLRNFSNFDRTRLFNSDWHITQQWTSVNVPWTADYNDTKFNITLKERSPVVIALSQLDDRYFKGLEGQYRFQLHFRLDKEGEHDYIVRSHGNYRMQRSVSTDLELEPGTYSVLMKITARRDKGKFTPEDIIRANVDDRQNKLIQVGLCYDLAHAKGEIRESAAEREERTALELRKKAADKKKERDSRRAGLFAKYEFEKRQRARTKRQNQREEAKKAAKAKVAEQVKGTASGIDENTQIDNSKSATAGGDGTMKKEAAGAAEDKTSAPAPDPAMLPSSLAEAEDREKATKSAAADATNDRKADKQVEAESKDDKPPAQETGSSKRATESISSLTVNDKPAQAPELSEVPSTLAPDDDLDYDSDASFVSSVDSVLDPLPEPTTGDENLPLDDGLPPIDFDDENKAFEDDPWNAVCVVGLKVYSKNKNADCCVEVVRPKKAEETLDLDDANKGASGEVEGDTNKVPTVRIEDV